MKPWGEIDVARAGYAEDFELESRRQEHEIYFEETTPFEVETRVMEMEEEQEEWLRTMQSTEKEKV